MRETNAKTLSEPGTALPNHIRLERHQPRFPKIRVIRGQCRDSFWELQRHTILNFDPEENGDFLNFAARGR